MRFDGVRSYARIWIQGHLCYNAPAWGVLCVRRYEGGCDRICSAVSTVGTPGRGMWSPVRWVRYFMGRRSEKSFISTMLNWATVMMGLRTCFVLVGDASSLVYLQPAASCISDAAARSILEWVSVSGIPKVFVRDRAPHFRNETLKLVASK